MVAGWEKVELDLNADPSNFKGPNRPVEQVSWHEAMEFCRRLSQPHGQTLWLTERGPVGIRLPSGHHHAVPFR